MRLLLEEQPVTWLCLYNSEHMYIYIALVIPPLHRSIDLLVSSSHTLLTSGQLKSMVSLYVLQHKTLADFWPLWQTDCFVLHIVS